MIGQNEEAIFGKRIDRTNEISDFQNIVKKSEKCVESNIIKEKCYRKYLERTGPLFFYCYFFKKLG